MKAASGEALKDKELNIKRWDMGEKHDIARAQIAANMKMASDNNDNEGGSDNG